MEFYNFEYIELLREVMVDATTKIQLKSNIVDKAAAMVKCLHFSKREDWMRFGSCLYTFEDASMAIRSYFATTQSGKNSDFDYLRLFGFLNAVYLQLGALDKLCGIVGIKNKKSVIKTLRDHKLITYRHMLASHINACKVGESIQSITIEQSSLCGTGATFIINETHDREQVNFEEFYISWVQETKKIFNVIIRTFVGKVYKTSVEKKKKYLGKMEVLKNTMVDR